MKEEDGTPPTFKTSDAVVAVEVMDACCLSVKVLVFKEEVRSIRSVFYTKNEHHYSYLQSALVEMRRQKNLRSSIILPEHDNNN